MLKGKADKFVILLIAVSFILRAFLAWSIELGNDEVYYWTYALFPDLSHFDHPPMVGLMIQIFSFDLLFDSEFWIRMSSLVLGSFNIWIIYIVGKRINGIRTGLYSALLYVSSLYGTVITGIFILPDTPQMFFWLISLYFIINTFNPNTPETKANRNLIFTGIFIGFGLLSKYTSIYLWTGIMIYILMYDRKWLKSGYLYLSVILSFLIFIPVIWWNFQNDFISLAFQGGRVNVASGISFRPDYFILEILGEFLYNNPINVILVITTVIGFFKIKKESLPYYLKILLSISLPLILTFIGFSLFKRTLPHWTAPAYTTLLIGVAYYLDHKHKSTTNQTYIPGVLKYSIGLLLLVMVVGFLQIKVGIIRFDDPDTVSANRLGKKDISLDIYGWRQIGEEFKKILKRDQSSGEFTANALISQKWFPAANLDYYAGYKNNIDVLGFSDIIDIHKYYWINQQRCGFHLGMNAYFITTSHDYFDPAIGYKQYFKNISLSDTIKIERGGRHVMNVFVYRLIDLNRLPKW